MVQSPAIRHFTKDNEISGRGTRRSVLMRGVYFGCRFVARCRSDRCRCDTGVRCDSHITRFSGRCQSAGGCYRRFSIDASHPYVFFSRDSAVILIVADETSRIESSSENSTTCPAIRSRPFERLIRWRSTTGRYESRSSEPAESLF